MRMVDRCSGSGVEQREDGMMGVNNLEETWEMYDGMVDHDHIPITPIFFFVVTLRVRLG